MSSSLSVLAFLASAPVPTAGVPSDAPRVEVQAAPSPPQEEPPLTRFYFTHCDSCAAGPLLSTGANLSRFADMSAADPAFAPTAQRFVARHHRSRLFLASGMTLGAGLMTVGFFVLPKSHCFYVDRSDPYYTVGEQRCSDGMRNYVTAGAGVLSAVLGTVAYLVMRPTEGELIHAVNRWNAQHPEAPFTPSPGSDWSRVLQPPPTGGR